MLDVLVNQDGSINTAAINAYIKRYGVDEPYPDGRSPYCGRTLLYIAICSTEIKPEIKAKLAAYLIVYGNADVKKATTAINGSLLGMALIQGNLPLATILLNAGANKIATYNNQNIADIALLSRNAKLMLWVLQKAEALFMQMEIKEFLHYVEKINAQFPSAENAEISQCLNDIANRFDGHAKNNINERLHKIKPISNEDVALIVAAKMSKKTYPTAIFVLGDPDISLFIAQIKKLIEHETNDQVIKFQIIHHDNIHAIFGGFEIDKTTKPPTVRYAHCDPTPSVTEYHEIITKEFIDEILPLANIEVYDSLVTLQKSSTQCSVFAIDGAMMMATPSDRNYAVDLMGHMRAHSTEDNSVYKYTNFTYKVCESLPARYIRGMQYVKDETNAALVIHKGLEFYLFQDKQNLTVVNKKGKTAEESIVNFLVKQPSKHDKSLMRIYNLRVVHKMAEYRKTVTEFIRDKKVLDPAFQAILGRQQITGFQQFCADATTLKPKASSQSRSSAK